MVIDPFPSFLMIIEMCLERLEIFEWYNCIKFTFLYFKLEQNNLSQPHKDVSIFFNTTLLVKFSQSD